MSSNDTLRRAWSAVRSFGHKCRETLSPDGGVVSRMAAIDMLAHNWFLGITAFGGPTVHFQIFRRLFVERYKWIDETTYLEVFALSQALSGPASTKMHFMFNIMHYGYFVGFLAFLVWSLPIALVSLGLGLGVRNIGSQLPDPVYALLTGLNSATVGIIALAAMQLSSKAITDKLTRILVFLGAAAGMLYNALWYFPVLMVAGALTTVVWDLRLIQRTWKAIRYSKTRDDETVESDAHELSDVGRATSSSQPTSVHARNTTKTEPTATHNSKIMPETPAEEILQPQAIKKGSWKVGGAILAGFFTSFIIVMACRGVFSDRDRGFDLFANLYLAGTIIFGGGPVVVPLLRSYVVEPGWVSSRDFLLGLAITQAFPGPNFNFAVYLGTLAAQGTSLPPVVGGLVAFLAIFTPGLWLSVGFMEIWSSVRKIRAVQAALRGVHASAVGLVFTAVYRLFEIGYLDAETQGGGTLSRDPWWVVIVATACFGGQHFHLSPPLAIVLGGAMGLIRYAIVS